MYIEPAELATRSHALASQSLNFTSKVAIHVQSNKDGHRTDMARRASRAVPHRATGLAFGPGMALWADFYAGPAREAWPES